MNVPAHEMQFHMYRLGKREHVAQLYGIGTRKLRKVYPISEIDQYNMGNLIIIGGILARKCYSCGTARELDRFHSKSTTSTGCGSNCIDCCTTKRRSDKLHAQYLAVRSKT